MSWSKPWSPKLAFHFRAPRPLSEILELYKTSQALGGRSRKLNRRGQRVCSAFIIPIRISVRDDP